jgi:hypothetical protein
MEPSAAAAAVAGVEPLPPLSAIGVAKGVVTVDLAVPALVAPGAAGCPDALGLGAVVVDARGIADGLAVGLTDAVGVGAVVACAVAVALGLAVAALGVGAGVAARAPIGKLTPPRSAAHASAARKALHSIRRNGCLIPGSRRELKPCLHSQPAAIYPIRTKSPYPTLRSQDYRNAGHFSILSQDSPISDSGKRSGTCPGRHGKGHGSHTSRDLWLGDSCALDHCVTASFVHNKSRSRGTL